MCTPQMMAFQQANPGVYKTPQQMGIEAMQAQGRQIGPGGQEVAYNGPVNGVGGPSYAGSGSATTGGRVVYTNPSGYEVPDAYKGIGKLFDASKGDNGSGAGSSFGGQQ